MATTPLGKTTNGTQSSTSSSDKMEVSSAVAAASGTITAGHGRFWLDVAGTAFAKLVLYADSAGAPGALLATSNEASFTNIAEAQIDFTFSGANQVSVVSGTTYWVGVVWKDPGTPNFTFSRDATASGRMTQSTVTYASGPPNPFGTGVANTGPIDVFLDITPAGGGASTSPVIRSFSVGTEASGSNTVNITKPAGLVAGDYLLALSTGDADNTLTSPLATLSSAANDGTNNIPPALFSGRVATAADAAAASFTFSSSFATGDQAIILVAITQGTFDPTTPVTVGTWTRTARTTTRTQTAPSMTGVVNGLLLALFATEENAVSQTYPAAGPTGMTLVASQGSTANYALAGMYSQVLAAAGATGTRVVTPTGTATTNGWSAALAMINPAPASASGPEGSRFLLVAA